MKYRHYKGGLYEFITTGYEEDTIEEVVIYKSLETNIVWVRNVHDFYGNVELINEEDSTITIVKRFEKVEDEENERL